MRFFEARGELAVFWATSGRYFQPASTRATVTGPDMVERTTLEGHACCLQGWAVNPNLTGPLLAQPAVPPRMVLSF